MNDLTGRVGRAAIEALREPGELILKYIADGSAPRKGAKDLNDWANHHYDPKGFWNALIDAILAEKEGAPKDP